MADNLRTAVAAVYTYTVDLADPTAIARLGEEVGSNTAHLDLVINNAFGKLEKPLHECRVDEIPSFIQVSVGGVR